MAEEVMISACRLSLDRHCLDLTLLPVRVEVEVRDGVARYQRRHRPSCYRKTPETCSGVWFHFTEMAYYGGGRDVALGVQ